MYKPKPSKEMTTQINLLFKDIANSGKITYDMAPVYRSCMCKYGDSYDTIETVIRDAMRSYGIYRYNKKTKILTLRTNSIHWNSFSPEQKQAIINSQLEKVNNSNEV